MIVEHVYVDILTAVYLSKGLPRESARLLKCYVICMVWIFQITWHFPTLISPHMPSSIFDVHPSATFEQANSQCSLHPMHIHCIQCNEVQRHHFPTAEGSGLYLTNAWEIWVRYVFVFVSDAGCSYPWHGIHLLSILSACLAWLHFSDLLNGISLDLWPIPLLFCRVRHIRLLDFLPTCSNDLFGHDPVIFS